MSFFSQGLLSGSGHFSPRHKNKEQGGQSLPSMKSNIPTEKNQSIRTSSQQAMTHFQRQAHKNLHNYSFHPPRKKSLNRYSCWGCNLEISWGFLLLSNLEKLQNALISPRRRPQTTWPDTRKSRPSPRLSRMRWVRFVCIWSSMTPGLGRETRERPDSGSKTVPLSSGLM